MNAGNNTYHLTNEAKPCRMVDPETHEEYKRFDTLGDMALFLGKRCSDISAIINRTNGNKRGRTKYNGKFYALRYLPTQPSIS